MTIEELALQWTRAHVRDPNDRNAAALLARTLESLATEVGPDVIAKHFASSVLTLDEEGGLQ